MSNFLTRCQAFLPQHALSVLAGWFANSRNPRIKTFVINFFLKRFTFNLAEAIESDPHAYASFNDFFTRTLKPGARPMDESASAIACPADGTVAERGQIKGQQCLQAKGMVYELSTLLANHPLAEAFTDGDFATVYLAPHNYHRVHMPLSGRLKQTIYIPGRLFSVNRMTTDLIPNLYGRNERLVCFFDTDIGPMAVILVGALIVGSMKTVWMETPIRGRHIQVDVPSQPVHLAKGDELGYFALGSTVIVLFGKDTMRFAADFTPGSEVKVRETMGEKR